LHRFDTAQECDERTNGRTNERTYTSTMAKTRKACEALHAVASKNRSTCKHES